MAPDDDDKDHDDDDQNGDMARSNLFNLRDSIPDSIPGQDSW